jgi:hypothetical protein
LYLGGASGYSAWYQNGTEQARLTSSGLEIKQSQLIGYNDYTGIGTNGLAVAGNVGVGTASPSSFSSLARNLVVNGTTSAGITISESTGGGTASLLFAATSAFPNKANITNDFASNSLQFGLNGVNRAFLDTAGNLGLGVTPSAWSGNFRALDVGTTAAFYAAPASAVFAAIDGNTYSTGAGAFYKTNGFAARYFQINNGNHAWYTAPSGTAGNAISFTQAMTLTAGGQLLVGTTTSALGVSGRGVIEVNGTSSAVAALKVNDTLSAEFFSDGTDLYILNDVNGAMRLYTNSIERARISSDGTFRVKGAGTAGSTDAFQVAGTAPADAARIDSSGNLLVGTTNNYSVGAEKNVFVKNGYVFASDNTGSADNRNWIAGVNGYQNGSWQLTSSGANNTWPNDAYRFAVTRDGSCYNTTGTYGTLSDARFKDNVATARPYLEDLIKLRVVKYSLKSEQSNVATKLGLIAQEVEEVFPNMVDVGITVQGEEFKSVKMSVLVPMLLSAIQEQQTLITALTARITALESSTLQ